MRLIVETNVHKHMGFPDKCNLDEFERVFKANSKSLSETPLPITMVWSLGLSKEEVGKSTKLSLCMKTPSREDRLLGIRKIKLMLLPQFKWGRILRNYFLLLFHFILVRNLA